MVGAILIYSVVEGSSDIT